VVDGKNKSEDALVLAAMLGSVSAFDALVRRYRPAIEWAAQNVLGCRAQSEEVAQDAFLLAFEHLPSLDDPRKFPGWLRAIARNRALRVREREGRLTELTEAQLVLRDTSAALHAPTDTDLALGRLVLSQALTRLASESREALLLRAELGWSVEEIATFQRVSPTTIRGRLQRARTALRGHFFEES
jgi:RNA polymerase sigma-70 factor, ECF subfamily